MATHVDHNATSFPAARAAELAGISLPMLNYLCRCELVIPTAKPSRGHGVRKAYSFGDSLRCAWLPSSPLPVPPS